MRNCKISFFNNIKSKPEIKGLEEVINLIKEGCYALKIKALHEAKAKDSSDFDKLKRILPAFTPSGVFSNSHRKDDLVSYNPIMVVDVDKIGIEHIDEVKLKASQLTYTYVAFVSPSGEGLKLLVKTDSTVEQHEEVFNQLADYYEKKLGVEIDRSGKDFSRLCFVSYDPELYFNDNSEIFKKEKMQEVTQEKPLFESIVTYTEKANHYYPGNRNNFTFLLANNFNRAGVDQQEAFIYITQHYTGLSDSEISSTLTSAYKNEEEHGIFPPEYIQTVSSASFASTANREICIKTPLIPDQVYECLPVLLKEAVSVFEVKRERDIILTASLAILSGSFNQVFGLYDRRKTTPNLFAFIIALAGSGKGIIRYAMKLCERIENFISANFLKTKDEGVDIKNVPISYFIPADSSSAAVIRHLKQNNESGVIFETEADTLSSTLVQDWGGYSQLIRMAFENECISNSRIGREEGEIYLQKINFPQLSMCISGTPNQVPALLHSTQDGLFSRFIFYTFKNDGVPSFKNVFDEDIVESYDVYFDYLSNKVFNYYQKYQAKGVIRFKLTINQQILFHEYFDRTKKKLYYEYGSETESIVNRLGKITFRIAMLLTILRNADLTILPDELLCNDIDFENSILLAETYLEHSLVMYQALPDSHKRNPNAVIFYEFLPTSFKRGEAIDIGTKVCGISEKTVDNYLSELRTSKLLEQPSKNGNYFKPLQNVQNLQNLQNLQKYIF